jgi:hypothetical protein
MKNNNLKILLKNNLLLNKQENNNLIFNNKVIFIINHQNGGIFSILLLGLMAAMEYNNISEFTIEDPYDVAKYVSSFEYTNYINYTPKNIYSDLLNIRNIKIKNFDLGKEILKKLKLNQDLLKQLQNYVNNFEIDNQTLGIHIRLTDMNFHHNYSRLTTDDYIKKTEFVLNENPSIKNIFIASDNHESIDELKKHFSNEKINFVENIFRSDVSILDNKKFMNKILFYLNHTNIEIKKKFIYDTFLDMLCLSKCGYLIYRISNVANFALLYSDSIEKIYKLD